MALLQALAASTLITLVLPMASAGRSSSSYAHFTGPVASASADEKISYPKYNFAYGVDDDFSGDNHRQKESRDGDRVVGEYSVVEPTGNVRTVRYWADGDNGFKAEVINSHDY